MLSAAETQILSTSFSVASLALLWSLPFAIGCAFALARQFPGKFLLDGLVHLPIILPPVPRNAMPMRSLLPKTLPYVLADKDNAAVLAAAVPKKPRRFSSARTVICQYRLTTMATAKQTSLSCVTI